MDTVEVLYLGLVIAAMLIFIVSVGFISWQTERYLQQGEGGRKPAGATGRSASRADLASGRLVRHGS